MSSELRSVYRAIRQNDDDIVISGIAGRYPKSDNLDEFAKNLYGKKDLLTDEEIRWENSISPEIPVRKGVMNNINKFDATFFGIHYKQANAMDPQGRLMIEAAFEAIMDAGVNPQTLREQNQLTGVFVASCYSETEKTLCFEKVYTDGFSLAG